MNMKRVIRERGKLLLKITVVAVIIFVLILGSASCGRNKDGEAGDQGSASGSSQGSGQGSANGSSQGSGQGSSNGSGQGSGSSGGLFGKNSKDDEDDGEENSRSNDSFANFWGGQKRDPLTEISWNDNIERELDLLNGLGYWDYVPGLSYGQCTGYLSWAARRIYLIEDFPQGISTHENRNAGEYVAAQRMWLKMHATLVGAAVTDRGQVDYLGERYQPGDIIVFNCRSDGKSGDYISTYEYDYWGEEEYGYYTHIGIVGSNTIKWEESHESEDIWEEHEAGTLPEGQYNLHHNIESHGGVVNMLSPEQFITRDVPDDDMGYARSYEVYRVLSPAEVEEEEA